MYAFVNYLYLSETDYLIPDIMSKISEFLWKVIPIDELKKARKNEDKWNTWTCVYTARCGHLEVLKWARENGCEWNYRGCLYYSEKYPLVNKWILANKS